MNGRGAESDLGAVLLYLGHQGGRGFIHSLINTLILKGKGTFSPHSKMVSSGVFALLVAVAVQAASASYYYPGDCGCAPPPVCKPAFEEGCCPGPVVEKKYITQKAVTVPYSYSVPTYSKKCYQQSAGVDKKVIPSAYETAPVCETQTTVIKVPTTDVEVKQQPLCKKTCTTSEYLIQIPIVETTCTSTPLCKKTVRTQENVLTTCASKTACAKQVCTQNKVIETPLTQTVCQDYQGSVCKTGAKTVLQPEVKKTCVQLPPYKCLKPVSDSPVSVSYPGDYYGAYPYGYAGAAYSGDYYGAYPYGADYVAPAPYPSAYPASYPAAYPVDAVYPAPASYYPSPAPTTCACACA